MSPSTTTTRRRQPAHQEALEPAAVGQIGHPYARARGRLGWALYAALLELAEGLAHPPREPPAAPPELPRLP